MLLSLTMKGIKLIIFDLDGTLIDAYPAIISSFNYTMRRLNYPKQTARVIRRAVGRGDENLLRPFIKEKDLSRALSIYRKHHSLTLRKSSRLFAQAGMLLAYLKNKGYKQVEIEKNIEGKKIDLFCIKDDKKIGIEICVSTQKTEHINIEKDKDKCDSLIIVCLDNNEQKKLIEQLGEMKNNAEIYALYEFLKAV